MHRVWPSCFALALSAAATQHGDSGETMKQKAAWYHTGAEVQAALRTEALSCQGADFDLSSESTGSDEDDVHLDVVRISRRGSVNKTKAMFVFGEHARELVTVESALELVGALCGQGPHADRASHVLEHTDFLIVPNANPLGRKAVEGGDFCKRTNENDVDLNRNWYQVRPDVDEHASNNPGPQGFSEPETRILRSLAESEKPHVYVSVHSGAWLFAGPDDDVTRENSKRQHKIFSALQAVSEEVFGGEVPYGRGMDLLGYKTQGDDQGYVGKALSVPYPLTFEIYAPPKTREYYIEEAHQLRSGTPLSKEAKNYFGLFKLFSFLQGSVGSSGRMLRGQVKNAYSEAEDDDRKDGGCFSKFNPTSEAETRSVKEKWSNALLALCEHVATNVLGVDATSDHHESPRQRLNEDRVAKMESLMHPAP